MAKSPKSELPLTTMFAELFPPIISSVCIAYFSGHAYGYLLSEIASRKESMPIMYIAITCNTWYMFSLTLFFPYIISFLLGKKNRQIC